MKNQELTNQKEKSFLFIKKKKIDKIDSNLPKKIEFLEKNFFKV